MVGFVLSKLLPLLVLPLGAALVLLTLALVLRRRWLVVLALGVLWLFNRAIAQLLWRVVEAPGSDGPGHRPQDGCHRCAERR